MTDAGANASPARPVAPRPPRLTLRVGVAGHRPGRLGQDDATLRRVIDRTLQHLVESVEHLRQSTPNGYLDEPARFRILSELAEGADRIVAAAALARGFELAAILPFPVEQYEHDFASAESLREFRDLKARAAAVLELDGSRGELPEAYAEAGRMLLRQCDVLIAVWDGEEGAGVGGTARVVEEALTIGMPVVWIDTHAPHHVLLPAAVVDPRSEARPFSAVAGDLQHLLFAADATDEVPAAYYGRKRAVPFAWGVFRAFRAVIELGHRNDAWTEISLPALDADVQREYEWADGLALGFGQRYRDAYVLNYVLGACAVTAAAAAIVSDHASRWTIAELAFLLVIVGIMGWAMWKHWHDRWLAYRLLAEQLRHLRYLRPLGYPPPRIRPAAHSEDVRRAQWGAWLFQARIRELPALTARFDAAYLATVRSYIQAEVENQCRFHASAAKRNRVDHHRLEAFGIIVFVVTIGVAIVHLGQEYRGGSASPWWSAFATFLPAFAAAFAGINNHGEFRRVAARSGAMAQALETIRKQLEAMRRPRSKALGTLAEHAAETMLTELFDWQLIFWGRPVPIPA